MQRSRVWLPAALLAMLVVPTTACDDDPTGPVSPEDVQFDPSLGVNLSQMTKLESGVYIQTRVAGSGPGAVDGDRLIVDYTLWLPDATVVEEAQAWEYVVAVTDVIPGFEAGMLGASKGETRLIVIPSDQAYGASPPVGIPPHSVLVFEVRVVDMNPPI